MLYGTLDSYLTESSMRSVRGGFSGTHPCESASHVTRAHSIPCAHQVGVSRTGLSCGYTHSQRCAVGEHIGHKLDRRVPGRVEIVLDRHFIRGNVYPPARTNCLVITQTWVACNRTNSAASTAPWTPTPEVRTAQRGNFRHRICAQICKWARIS